LAFQGSCEGLTVSVFGTILLRMATAGQIQKNLRDAMKEALRIQDRFVAEPLFARTGRGYLKSEGVATLQKIKSSLHRKSSAKAR
jgi:hypothetical protein